MSRVTAPSLPLKPRSPPLPPVCVPSVCSVRTACVASVVSVRQAEWRWRAMRHPAAVTPGVDSSSLLVGWPGPRPSISPDDGAGGPTRQTVLVRRLSVVVSSDTLHSRAVLSRHFQHDKDISSSAFVATKLFDRVLHSTHAILGHQLLLRVAIWVVLTRLPCNASAPARRLCRYVSARRPL